MRREIAVALVGFVALTGGCASPAHYVKKDADSGIIAIPANTNTWPNYNRREAEALIQKHVGPNYELGPEYEFVTGQSTTNNQQTNTEAVPNRRNPNQPGERQTTTGTTMQQNITEWRIEYRRKIGPVVGDTNMNGMTTGLTPANGVVPTGGTYRPRPFVNDPNSKARPEGSGVVPSVLPGGGVPARGATGPTSYFSPSSRPGSVKPACSA